MRTRISAEGSHKQGAESTEAICRLNDNHIYDQLVEEYYGSSGFMNFGYWDEDTQSAKEASENLMEKLLSFIPAKRGTILDVACGRGATTRYLLKHYPPSQVIGTDISEKQLAMGRQNAPVCGFLLMDAVDLDFEDASLNNILCVEAAFHFNTRERFLQEAHRVLCPGGRIVLSDAVISRTNQEEKIYFPEKNFVQDLNEYRLTYLRVGFRQVDILDETKRCWERGFWNVVRYAHGKFLRGHISAEQLFSFLEGVYRLAHDLEYYVLVAATK